MMIEFSFVKRMGKQLGWYHNNYAIFGLYKGYFFTIKKLNGLGDDQRQIAITLPLDRKKEEQINTVLNYYKKELYLTKFTIEYGTITVFYNRWQR
ncbi:MAG: hypothetical protein AAF734_06890, partial [Bacteroidota bacterium]